MNLSGRAEKSVCSIYSDGRGQSVVYHALFEPGVFGWPEHAGAATDQVSHLSHMNARDATLAYASRARGLR